MMYLSGKTIIWTKKMSSPRHRLKWTWRYWSPCTRIRWSEERSITSLNFWFRPQNRKLLSYSLKNCRENQKNSNYIRLKQWCMQYCFESNLVKAVQTEKNCNYKRTVKSWKWDRTGNSQKTIWLAAIRYYKIPYQNKETKFVFRQQRSGSFDDPQIQLPSSI